MQEFDALDILFISTAYLFEILLIVHFALRRWHFLLAVRQGWIIYAFGIPAAVISAMILAGGKAWTFWLGGFLCLAWAALGYGVEYAYKIQWRSPVKPAIFAPYVILYLAANMFYWFPLGLLWKPLWYGFGLLFVTSTYLNATSHRGQPEVLVTSAAVNRQTESQP